MEISAAVATRMTKTIARNPTIKYVYWLDQMPLKIKNSSTKTTAKGIIPPVRMLKIMNTSS
jgi:hypothetical protein